MNIKVVVINCIYPNKGWFTVPAGRQLRSLPLLITIFQPGMVAVTVTTFYQGDANISSKSL